jgi:hypothetical protein
MAAGTALNESLSCVALGYVTYEREHSLEGFHQLITETSGTLWNKVISRCEISDKSINTYRNAYADKDGKISPWIYTSYYTAVEIIDKLKIQNLQDYKFSKVEKNDNYMSYILKQKATSAIKKYSKLILGNRAGILATLNADKVNIGDIFIIKNNSKKYKEIKTLIENTDVTESKLKKDVLENEKEFLTMEKYRNLMIEAWKDNEIYSVSLKQLDETSKRIPVKVFNLPSTLSRTFLEQQQDEFATYLSYLMRIAKSSGNTYQQFEDAINEFVDIKPVVFTDNDRLLVYFDLVYKKQERKHYHIFTNFGTGNAIHFVPKGSKSASGEGGITVNYFYTLTKNYPKLKIFFRELSDARIYHFEQACKKYNLDSRSINKDLGTNSMYSGKYDSSLYLAKNYEDLADKMLEGKSAYGYLSKNDANLTANVETLQEFFTQYTAYMSKTPGSMGKFLGIANKSKIAMRGKISKIKKEIENEKKKKGLLNKDDRIKILSKYKSQFSTEYKKSYTLLTNAEFGFFFAKHQADVEEVLKKQVLLSFYSAASGRGYIIFDGKRFSEDDIFEKNVAPPPFLKVGM